MSPTPNRPHTGPTHQQRTDPAGDRRNGRNAARALSDADQAEAPISVNRRNGRLTLETGRYLKVSEGKLTLDLDLLRSDGVLPSA